MNSEEEILEKLRELKPVLREDFSVRRIGLFGSFTDGTSTETSDIDILIEFEKPIGWRFFSLEIFLERIFGRKVDLVTRDAIKEQIKEQILEQVKEV